jgi:hypothetical protein
MHLAEALPLQIPLTLDYTRLILNIFYRAIRVNLHIPFPPNLGAGVSRVIYVLDTH